MRRSIIRIDEDKCDGCGQCVLACAEGALQIVDGKARLVKESYCDGLGACLGECPRGAITVEQRDAEPFDADAVKQHQARRDDAPAELPCGCPGSMARRLDPPRGRPAEAPAGLATSQLTNWPVQLRLVPPAAPYLQDADLLICADCVPFALPDFHRKLLAGNVVLVGCPKLDDAAAYVDKLAVLLAGNAVRSITVAHMEVPCCGGLVAIVEAALAKSGRADLEMRDLTVTIGGEVEEQSPQPGATGANGRAGE
jgi:NAD-dependent dihydropyrimidine dehydrogenase PreA subunit